MLIVAHVLLDHVECDFQGLEVSLVRPVIRPFFEVLLPFGIRHADPTEVLPALGALNLRVATADESDVGATFSIGAALSAVL